MIFSLIALSSIVGIIFGFFQVIQSTTTEKSNEALIGQIQTNMLKSAQDNALYIEQTLQNAIEQVDAAGNYAEYIFRYSDEFGTHANNYNDTDSLALGLNAQYDDDYQTAISFNHSAYHLAPRAYTTDYSDANNSVQLIINKSAFLDESFIAMKNSNPDFAWIYMGFQKGVQRGYPWHSYSTAYDPIERGWFNLALTTPGEIVITDPYIDASGLGLMITIARTVHYTNDTLIGVIAADLTIDTIVANILDIQILDSGYAFMIDENSNVIAHPELDEETFTAQSGVMSNITQFEPISGLLTQIQANNQGVLSFEKESVETYLAYAKINSTDYKLINIVPESEVIAAANQLSTEIQGTSQTVITSTIIIVLIAIGIAAFLGTGIATRITKPIKKLTDSVQKLTQKSYSKSLLDKDTKIEIDSELESQNDEIGDLTRAFKGMLQAIKEDSAKN